MVLSWRTTRPDPAATVVVLRDSSMRTGSLHGPPARRDRVRGAHVFPGGRVDASDGELATGLWCDGLAARRAAAPRPAAARGNRLSRRRGARAVRGSGRPAGAQGRDRVRFPRRRDGTRAIHGAPRRYTRARSDAARGRGGRIAPRRARCAAPVRALGDAAAADRGPPVRHAVLHDPRARRPDRRRTTTARRRTASG